MRNRMTFVGSRFIPENKNLERRASGCVFFETKTDETPEPGSRGGHSYFENARILGDLHDLQETHLEEKSNPLPQFAYSSKI